jgi:large subunit ribosomal protein L21
LQSEIFVPFRPGKRKPDCFPPGGEIVNKISMYAIVEIAGQQFKVEKQQKLFVHRLKANVGDLVNFDKVLLIEDGDMITVGTPNISGAVISAKVLDHIKGNKVLVFKKKRRKGYQKMNGHRQLFTQIAVEDITVNGEKTTVTSEPSDNS